MDRAVKKRFENYPKEIKPKMIYLRKLVLDTASNMDNVSSITQTLKWGEPSFLVEHGSTLRMDWKSKKPNQYAMYFKCTSKLVSTFREVFGEIFKYEKNRAIIFNLEDNIPEYELGECIKATLRYHKVKHLKQLGIDPMNN